MRLLRQILAPVLFVFAAAVLGAAVPRPGGPAGSDSLAGQFLVAAPQMGDPRFRQTVILMVRNERSGAFGLIINRPLGEKSIASLLEALGQDTKGIEGNVRLNLGGPVQIDQGFVIHSAEYHRAGTVDIDEHLAMTANPTILRDIGSGRGPAKSLLTFGYSGWGPGQLEEEIAHGDWFTAPNDPRLIFDEARDKVWDEALSRRWRAL